MGFRDQVAQQQFLAANVRFGSKADIAGDQLNVRFTPKSGHWNSAAKCPLCGKSGHYSLIDHLIGKAKQRY
jgi:hypothetical protein